MRKIIAQLPFYAVYESGVVVDIGSGDYILSDGQTSAEYATEKDRALSPDVAAWELSRALLKMDGIVQDLKSADAYSGKLADARKLMEYEDGGSMQTGWTYDAAEYLFLDIDVRHKSITPLTAAQAIIAAAERTDEDDLGTIAREDKRVELAEYIKLKRGL